MSINIAFLIYNSRSQAFVLSPPQWHTCWISHFISCDTSFKGHRVFAGQIRVLRLCQMLRLYSVGDELMTLEHWWNDTVGGQPKSLEKNLSQCHFSHHKAHSHCWAPCVRMTERPGKRCQGQRLNTKIASWIKRDQLDVTCFFISLFNAQHAGPRGRAV